EGIGATVELRVDLAQNQYPLEVEGVPIGLVGRGRMHDHRAVKTHGGLTAGVPCAVVQIGAFGARVEAQGNRRARLNVGRTWIEVDSRYLDRDRPIERIRHVQRYVVALIDVQLRARQLRHDSRVVAARARLERKAPDVDRFAVRHRRAAYLRAEVDRACRHGAGVRSRSAVFRGPGRGTRL